MAVITSCTDRIHIPEETTVLSQAQRKDKPLVVDRDDQDAAALQDNFDVAERLPTQTILAVAVC